MKIKELKRMSIGDGDLLVFNANEFDTTEKRQNLLNELAAILKEKHIGIMFVNNVHDDVAIKKHFVEFYEKKRTVPAVPEVQQENKKSIS